MKLAFRKRSETKGTVELIPKSEASREVRRRSADDWSYTLDVNDQALFAGRGFTGHSLSREERNGKHLPEFGLINMNGRLYDPLLGRFLSPDNNVQLPDFSQNFNRYSYALNNPLKYTDPSGEFIFTLLAAIFLPPVLPFAIAADVGWMTDYAVQAATNYLSNPNGKLADWLFKDIDFVDLGVSAIAGAASQGLANASKVKKGHKLLKSVIEYGLPAISAMYDWEPFSCFK